MIFGVEQVALAIVLEDRAEHPAVAVEIGELRVLELLVEFRRPDLFEKVEIDQIPRAAAASGFASQDLIALLVGRIVLLGRIHVLAVGFVVPPDVAEIRRDHVGAGMDVADDALAGRNRARELVLDRMARFVLRNGRIDLRAVALIAVRGVGPGMHRRAVVGVDHMAGRAAAGAVVAGMIVGAGQRKQRIEQARLLQAQKHRDRCAARVPRPRSLSLSSGSPGIFFADWDCRSRSAASPPRSKTRRMLPGCETSQRASGSRYGSMPLVARQFLAIGGGYV